MLTTGVGADLDVFLINTWIGIIVLHVGHIGAADQNKDGNACQNYRCVYIHKN